MKKTILVFIAALPLCACAQIEAGFGAGYNSADKSTIANVYLGYAAGPVHVAIEERPTLSRIIGKSTYLGFKAGLDLLPRNDDMQSSLILSAGGYYNKVSSDDKTLNGYYPGISAKYIYYIRDLNGIFADALYINKSVEILFGLHVTLN